MEKFIVIKDSVRQIRRYNITGRSLEFKLKAVPSGVEPVGWIKDAINQVIEKTTENLASTDYVGFSFCSKDFARGEGWLRFKPAEEVNYENIWDVISSIYQSNSSGVNTESFCLRAISVRPPTGSGKRRGNNTYNSFTEECGMRRGIISITNKDNLCLPRALVVALAYVQKDPEMRKVRQNTGNIQTTRATTLLRNAGLNISEEGAGLPALQKFQQYLQEFRIVVYSYGSKGRDVIYEGAVESNKRFNLLHHEGLYNVITSLTAAFTCSYYCEECHIPFDHKKEHRCGGTCQACQQSPKCLEGQLKIRCEDCKRYFKGETCCNNHKVQQGKSNVCSVIKSCENCFKTFKTNRTHVCGEIFYKNCYSHVPENHMCYIQRDNGNPKTKDFLFVFYDVETRQEEVLEDNSLLHEPNLCVFKQCCDVCLNNKEEICKRCGVRLQKIQGANPISSFLIHLLEIRKKFKDVVVLAHNGQAFDHQFVLNHIMTETDLTPELIMRGTKIIMMKVGNMKFIDSLNYFPMSLAKLPKAFGLGSNFKKDYFPHLFNTKTNENYVGPMPASDFYSQDTMKAEDRSKFLEWYQEHKDDRFDMQKELVEYCVSDVEILEQACLKFREQLPTTTNVCPFTEATTIASACNKGFRRNFLKPNTIGIIPKNGYRFKDCQSQIALKWLLWIKKQRNINILHAGNGSEVILKGAKVDGFFPETKEAFEFQGCYYHGFPKCYKFGRCDPLPDDPSITLNSRYESTVAKIENLIRFGYTVTEIWERDFHRNLMENPEIKTYTEKHPLLTLAPLNPRDAFYGGHTGNVWEFYEVKDQEKIRYVYVCSLYPFVCKYGKFPIGHPQLFVGNDECKKLDLKNTAGLIKCRILPPQDLYHPVLPQKMNNKLMFVLCRSCGEAMSYDVCTHDDNDRALEGTWVIDELVKALEKGYELLDIVEIWKYKVVTFNKATGEEGLFTSMMNKFIKIKQEASGWPSNCQTQEEKNMYVEDFFKREDVKLDCSAIVENPGLRSLATLMLNSFWGKFGQRENQPKTKIINEPSEFFNMLHNPTVYINSILPVNEKTLIVNYENIEEVYDPLHTVNVVVASYVTAQARIKLYSYLETLNDKVLYYDTDSVVYVVVRTRGERVFSGHRRVSCR